MPARNLAQITSVVGPVNNPACPTLTAVCMGQAHTDQSVVAAYTLSTRVEWPEPEAQHSLSLPSTFSSYGTENTRGSITETSRSLLVSECEGK